MSLLVGRSRPFKAEEDGICWGCLESILIGDLVVIEEGEVVHVPCTLEPEAELEEEWID